MDRPSWWFLISIALTALSGLSMVESLESSIFGKLPIDVEYSVVHAIPSTATRISANVSHDSLLCFGNRDYKMPSYVQTFLCMLPLSSQIFQNYVQCDSIWGSRGVVVDVHGSVEFLKVNRMPAETLNTVHNLPIRATRWLELQSISSYVSQREIMFIPAEPFYLCARSNDWNGGESRLSIEFRTAYLREKDREMAVRKTILHIILVTAVSSVWLLPYIAAFVTYWITYTHGLDRFLIVLVLSVLIILSTPLMLTRKNRHLAVLYFNYFFHKFYFFNEQKGIASKETRTVLRERLPLFQAVFFSSAVMCVGTSGSYIIYSYFGIDRETRNEIIKIVMGLAISWLVFFLCRSFEVFFKKWAWLGMTVSLLKFMESHLNPMCREEAMAAITLMTLFIDKVFIPKLNFPQSATVRKLLGIQIINGTKQQLVRDFFLPKQTSNSTSRKLNKSNKKKASLSDGSEDNTSDYLETDDDDDCDVAFQGDMITPSTDAVTRKSSSENKVELTFNISVCVTTNAIGDSADLIKNIKNKVIESVKESTKKV